MEINKKYARTTQSQLEAYITFIEQHPEFLTGKNSPDAPNRMDDLWDELSGRLNSQIGPTKTASAWKENLRNWRKQLKSKARKVRAEILRTGGGVSSATSLTAFEERALQSLGSVTITGLSGTELGFGGESALVQPIIGRVSPIIIEAVTTPAVTESTPPPPSPLLLLAQRLPPTLNAPSPLRSPALSVPRQSATPVARRRHRRTPNGLMEYLQQEASFRREELQLKQEKMEMQKGAA